jgi:hypothetical protein
MYDKKAFYSDIKKVCNCGREFVVTGGQQSFLHDLVDRLTIGRDNKPMEYNEPKYCPECKAKKRARFGENK